MGGFQKRSLGYYFALSHFLHVIFILWDSNDQILTVPGPWKAINLGPARPALTTHLVEMATLQDGYQPNNRLTVFQCLVEDGVGISFNGCLFLCRSSMVLLKLLPFQSFQSPQRNTVEEAAPDFLKGLEN